MQLVADHAMARVAAVAGAAAPTRAAARVERVDLGRVPVAAVACVRSRGGMAEGELTLALARELGVERLEPSERRLLEKLIWSARGRRMLVAEEGRLVPGPVAPAPIAELEGRSLDELARLAVVLAPDAEGDEELFEALLERLGEGAARVPRIVAVAAGAGIALARRRGQLAPSDGQAPLFAAEDAA